MTTSPTTLDEALKTAGMLVIDGLHAWDFFYGNALTLECMDGRERKTWRFEMEHIAAATFDQTEHCWLIVKDDITYRMQCFSDVIPPVDDDDDEQEGPESKAD